MEAPHNQDHTSEYPVEVQYIEELAKQVWPDHEPACRIRGAHVQIFRSGSLIPMFDICVPGSDMAETLRAATGALVAMRKDTSDLVDKIRSIQATGELRRIVEALKASGGNITQAATSLGLSRYQVLRRLRRAGLKERKSAKKEEPRAVAL